MKLRSKISLFLIPVIALPMIVLGWVAHNKLEEIERTKSLDQAQTFISQITARISSLRNVAIGNINILADTELLKRYMLTDDMADRYELYQPALMRQFVSYQKAFPEYFEIRIIMPDGSEDMRVTTRDIPNSNDLEVNSPIVTTLMASDADIITQVSTHPDNEELCLHVAKRIFLKDPAVAGESVEPTLRGYLLITISLENILQQVTDFEIGENGRVMVYNNHGHIWDKVIFDRQGIPNSHNEKPPANVRTILDQLDTTGNSQASFDINVDGQQVLVKANNIIEQLWLLTWLPRQDLIHQAQSLSYIVVGIAILIILITLGAIYQFLNRSVIRPIDNLGQAALQIGRGNLKDEVKVEGDDEIALLAKSFEEMRNNLQSSNDQIHYLAYHDHLTGLPNRLMFREYLGRVLAHAKRHKQEFALLFLDLDNFKKINDSLGHEFGDQVLEEFAGVLMHSLRKQDYIARMDFDRPDDIVARLGGDEFVILLPNKGDGYEAGVVARRLLDSLQQPLKVDGQQVYVQASMGITLYPQDGAVPDELIKNADIAMYHAKALGKNNYQFFSQSLNEAVMQRLAIENKLRKALEEKQFFLHYQPRLCARSNRIVALEALIRWRDPELGMVPPDQFIPVAEETGLIVPIGEWVVEAACRQLKQWQRMGFVDMNVSVNVSSIQVGKANISQVIRDILGRVGLDPASLEVELTESTMMEASKDVLAVLEEIRTLGVKIALDDFGTGYSSLNYLRRFPINNLKIDRSFVSEIESHESGQAIISGIIAMAHALKLEVIAEGVENEAQLAFLRKRHCDQLQGYLLYKPMAAQDITQLLRLQQQDSVHLMRAKDA